MKKEARNISNLEGFKRFFEKILSNPMRSHGYDWCARGSALAGLAAINLASEQLGGLTGFLAGCVMWEIVPELTLMKPPMRLIEYNDMLYPQSRHMFTTITQEIWDIIQERAKDKIREHEEKVFYSPCGIPGIQKREYVSSRVWEHWKSIERGEIPFGYTIE